MNMKISIQRWFPLCGKRFLIEKQQDWDGSRVQINVIFLTAFFSRGKGVNFFDAGYPRINPTISQKIRYWIAVKTGDLPTKTRQLWK